MRFLLFLSMASEKTAPNSATTETIVAAMRNGEGVAAVASTEEIRSRSALAIRIRRTSRGMAAFFVSITNSFGDEFLL